jgi:hypothetical protein
LAALVAGDSDPVTRYLFRGSLAATGRGMPCRLNQSADIRVDSIKRIDSAVEAA